MSIDQPRPSYYDLTSPFIMFIPLLPLFPPTNRCTNKGDVAAKLGVSPTAVDLKASAGSVNVDVKVTVDDPAAASAVAASAAKSGLVDESVFGPCEVSGVETPETRAEARAAAEVTIGTPPPPLSSLPHY